MKRWICWLVVAALIAAVVFHGPLLRAVANQLVASDRIEPSDTLVVVSGDQTYTVAADLFSRKQVRQIVLLKEPIRPLVQYKILEPQYEIRRREMMKRGVPDQAISVAPGEIHSIWDTGDRLRERLQADSADRIIVLSDSFHSNRLRWVFKRTLTEDQLGRIRILAIRDRRFDETNWWKHRLGITTVVISYLRFLHTSLAGRPPRFVPPVQTPEAIERRLLAGSHAGG